MKFQSYSKIASRKSISVIYEKICRVKSIKKHLKLSSHNDRIYKIINIDSVITLTLYNYKLNSGLNKGGKLIE